MPLHAALPNINEPGVDPIWLLTMTYKSLVPFLARSLAVLVETSNEPSDGKYGPPKSIVVKVVLLREGRPVEILAARGCDTSVNDAALYLLRRVRETAASLPVSVGG